MQQKLYKYIAYNVIILRKGVMMKKLLLVAILLLLNVASIYSLNDINIKIAPLKNSITPVQNATYSTVISNNLNRDLTFEFRYFDVDWRLDPEKITVPAFSTRNTILTLIPQSTYSDQKSKVVRIKITSNDGSFAQDYLLDIDVLKYSDILDQSSSNFVVPDPIDPRKPTLINVKLTNTKDATLEFIEVRLLSPFFDQKKSVSLDPLESTTLDFQIQVTPDTKFGSYPLTALVTFRNRILSNYTTIMKIGNYPNVLEQQSPRSGFLLDVIEITKKNEGNSVSHEVITKKLTTLQKIFTKTNPKPTSIEHNNGYFLRWKFDLQPGESKTVSIETNYRTFFIIIVVLVILIILIYSVTKRDIVIRKKLVSIKKENDGTSIVKISITVKNKGFSKFHNVKVMDRIPKIVESPFEFGSGHPKTIHTPHGLQMIWEIVTFSPQEERIFSYKARIRLQIIGKTTLPSAVAKYIRGNRTLMVSSNPELIFS